MGNQELTIRLPIGLRVFAVITLVLVLTLASAMVVSAVFDTGHDMSAMTGGTNGTNGMDHAPGGMGEGPARDH